MPKTVWNLRTWLKFEWVDKKHNHPKADWRTFSLWTHVYIIWGKHVCSLALLL